MLCACVYVDSCNTSAVLWRSCVLVAQAVLQHKMLEIEMTWMLTGLLMACFILNESMCSLQWLKLLAAVISV